MLWLGKIVDGLVEKSLRFVEPAGRRTRGGDPCRGGGHVSPDGSTAGEKQGNGGQPAVVMGPLEIAIQQLTGPFSQPMAIEIHEQKRQVIENIDAGESVVELDGIEKHRLFVDQADVVEMKVTVTAADEALILPPVEQ